MDLSIFLHVIIESAFAMLCIIAAIYIRLYASSLHGISRIMTYGLITSAVINISDSMAYLFRGNVTETGFTMTRVSNFIVFAGMFVLLAVGNSLIDKVITEKGGGKDTQNRNAVYIVCTVALCTLVILRLFGLLYYFDEQNLYHRSTAYFLLPLFGIIALALMTARIVTEKNVLSKGRYYAFLCFCLLPAAGALLQMVSYGISYSNIANSISLIIILTVFMREAIAGLSVRKSFILSGAAIDNMSEEIDSFLKAVGTERQNCIRIRLTVEEALLRIWQNFGDLEMVSVAAGIKFGRPSIRIMHYGDAFNPFIKTGKSYDDWSSGLLSSAGLSPSYSYSHGRNTIKIPLTRMSVNPVVIVLIAIAFGLLSGTIAMAALSEGDAGFVSDEILVPVYNLWNNMLFSVSAPAMLLIVTSTMLNTREVSEQGGNTGFITGRYFCVMLLMGAVTIGAAGIVARGAFSAETLTRHTIAELIEKLFSVIPENLLDPIVDFNTAKLIMMGLVLAYAIMAVGQPASGLASIIQQLNMIAMQLAQWIARFMPLFTIFLTAKLVLDHNAGLLSGLLMIIPFALIVSVICVAGTVIYVSRHTGVSPWNLLKKLLPTLIVALKTGQVADSYALAEKCCIRSLGIQKVFTQQMMPLGLVLYMPASMIGMMSFVIYAAFRSGISITPVWMITAVIFALILLVAAPPIPGVNLLSYVVIIEQLGIGREYVIAAMVFDIIFDLFSSAVNQMMLQMDLMIQADRVGMLDRKILWKDGGK